MVERFKDREFEFGVLDLDLTMNLVKGEKAYIFIGYEENFA